MSEEIYEHIKELVPFKLEFVDDQDSYYKLDSYVKSLHEDHFLISPAKKDGLFYNIPLQKEVNLIFAKEGGVFIAQCMILGKELDRQYGIKVGYPVNTKTLERREYIRVPIKVRAEVTSYSDPACLGKNSFFGITRNISGSGIAVYHKEPIGEYYDLGVKIYLNDGDSKPVETKCDLVYSQEVKIKDEPCYLSAFTYTSIFENDSSRIVKECFKYQIKCKKVKGSSY